MNKNKIKLNLKYQTLKKIKTIKNEKNNSR